MSQTRSRTPVTSKIELFVTIFNGFQPLKIFTKSSILQVAVALDRTLITDIFSQTWILINLKPILP